jgi:hypothetical protein
MTVPANISSEVTALRSQIAAAAPLTNASYATITALQLNAEQLVNDSSAALLAPSILDNYVVSPDPAAMIPEVLQIYQTSLDMNNINVINYKVGRVSINLDQL